MPPKLKHFTNPDKPFRREHGLQPGFVSRIFACGPPDSGKRSALLSIMGNEPGGFDSVTVVHLSTDTNEMDILNDQPQFKLFGYCDDGIPGPEYFSSLKGKKHLLWLEEIPFGMMNKHQKSDLDRTFNYTSTHCGVTIYCCAQDFYQIPASARRSATHLLLFKSAMKQHTSLIGRSIGINLNELFSRFCTARHDHLMVDFASCDDDLLVRKNTYEPISNVRKK
jgi:hypothetical protein